LPDELSTETDCAPEAQRTGFCAVLTDARWNVSADLLKDALAGCYVTIPTPFHDAPDLPVNEAALRQYVRFLIDAGLTADYATFLAGGAAGDFSTMTFDERVRVAEIVVDEVAGRVPVAMGAQTTSTQEVVRLARAARKAGAQFIQVSCPFYFTHTEDDFEEFVRAAAEAEPDLGIILYNTFWTSQSISFAMVERIAEIPNIVGLKWATPRTDAMEFEDVVARFSRRFTIIDNNLFFAFSSMPALGARAFEVHLCNFWPEWGIKLIDEVRAGNHVEIARMLVEEAMPFYKLWVTIERNFTSGDGYLDKLCMDLVGLPSSRCRPPTRDVRPVYRAEALEMLLAIGAPRVNAKPHLAVAVPH
jgi:dihydrodipicolinate synthase/N-acetylneuraminate lyase